MKLFCRIQHYTNGVKDAAKVFASDPAQIRAAKRFWTRCVDGKEPHTTPQEWRWKWPNEPD